MGHTTTHRARQTDTAWRAGLEEALKRKDAIIRVRNAQISALWDELHTRQPWTNALAGDAPINLARLETANASRKLLVIGINTVRAPHTSLQPGLYSLPAICFCEHSAARVWVLPSEPLDEISPRLAAWVPAGVCSRC